MVALASFFKVLYRFARIWNCSSNLKGVFVARKHRPLPPVLVNHGKEVFVGEVTDFLRRCLANLGVQEMSQLANSKNEFMARLGNMVIDLTEPLSDRKRRKEFARIASGYESCVAIHKVLDLNVVCRNTLQYIFDGIGRSDTAIYLPIGDSEYRTSYVASYNPEDVPPSLLFEELNVSLVPHFGENLKCLHLINQSEVAVYIGTDALYLKDSHLLAIACCEVDEVLAVVVMCRHKDEPFLERDVDFMHVVAPLFAKRLAKIVRIHTRLQY